MERTRTGAPRRGREIVEHVVGDRDVIGPLARRKIVGAEDVHAAGRMAHEVVLKA